MTDNLDSAPSPSIETRQQAFERFQEIFAEQARPEALPASIVLAARGVPITVVKGKAEAFPGAKDMPTIACGPSEAGVRIIADAAEHGQARVP